MLVASLVQFRRSKRIVYESLLVILNILLSCDLLTLLLKYKQMYFMLFTDLIWVHTHFFKPPSFNFDKLDSNDLISLRKLSNPKINHLNYHYFVIYMRIVLFSITRFYANKLNTSIIFFEFILKKH